MGKRHGGGSPVFQARVTQVVEVFPTWAGYELMCFARERRRAIPGPRRYSVVPGEKHTKMARIESRDGCPPQTSIIAADNVEAHRLCQRDFLHSFSAISNIPPARCPA